MVKGTIETKDFYGKIKSINWLSDVSVNDTLVNKSSAQLFNVDCINLTINENGKPTGTSYVLTRIGGTYQRVIPYHILRQRFYKVVKND